MMRVKNASLVTTKPDSVNLDGLVIIMVNHQKKEQQQLLWQEGEAWEQLAQLTVPMNLQDKSRSYHHTKTHQE